MRKTYFLIFSIFFFISCQTEVEKYGKHFQKHKDFYSLQKATGLIPEDSDTLFVRKILGEPYNSGFDYRYLSDSISINNCQLGAVFGIGDNGKIDWKDTLEICE